MTNKSSSPTSKKKPNKADLLVYKALTRAIEEDKLRLYFDYGKINRPGSPVYDPWETLLPILVPTLLGMLLILSNNVIFGLVFIISMILIYSNYFKKKVYRRLIERAKQYFVKDYDNCQNLWDFGGLVLVNADDKKSGCVSPEGDWKEFTVKNFADYMVENKKKTKKHEEPEQENTASLSA